MENLIKALQIFLKYGNPENPTHCEHGILYICDDYDPEDFSKEDIVELEKLGFYLSDQGWFISHKYGSA